jgi:Tfp pilus assembly protein PilO
MNKIDKELILSKISSFKDNAKAVMIFAAVIVLLDAAVILRFQVVSLFKQYSRSKQLKVDILRTREESKNSTSTKDKLTNLNEEFDRFSKRIIVEEEIPRILESISKSADLCGVRILKIRPEGAVAQKAVSAKGKAGKEPQEYARLKISINLRGGFHQLGRFVALLENSSVFLDLKRLEIQSDEQEYLKQVVTIILEVVIKKA